MSASVSFASNMGGAGDILYTITGAPGGTYTVQKSNQLQDLIDLVVGISNAGGGGGGGVTVLASGQVTLSSGSATYNNAAITATAKVALALSSPSNSGWIVPTVSAGSVTFASTNATDASKINFIVFA